MKNLFALLSLLSAGLAQASVQHLTYSCRQPELRDAGTIVQIYMKGAQIASARIEEDNFMGAQLMAHVTCREVKAEGPNYPDRLYTLAICESENMQMGDTGYKVALRSGGFAGRTFVDVTSFVVGAAVEPEHKSLPCHAVRGLNY